MSGFPSILQTTLPMRFSLFLRIRMDFNTFDVFHTSVLNWPFVASGQVLPPFDLILVVSGLWCPRCSRVIVGISCSTPGASSFPATPVLIMGNGTERLWPRQMRHLKNRWCLKWSKWLSCHFLFDFDEFPRYTVHFKKINTNVYSLPTVLAAPLGFKWVNPKLSKKGALLSQVFGRKGNTWSC